MTLTKDWLPEIITHPPVLLSKLKPTDAKLSGVCEHETRNH